MAMVPSHSTLGSVQRVIGSGTRQLSFRYRLGEGKKPIFSASFEKLSEKIKVLIKG
jgi:hypothetical protein